MSPRTVDPSLYRAVDADAIAALVAHEATEWAIQFSFGGHEVTVEGGGTIVVDGQRFEDRL